MASGVWDVDVVHVWWGLALAVLLGVGFESFDGSFEELEGAFALLGRELVDALGEFGEAFGGW